MGLLKPVVSPNGVPLEYYRITDLKIFTNEQNIISVTAYINQEQREKEAEGLAIEREKALRIEEGLSIDDLPVENVYVSPYTDASVYVVPYDQYMTIESAYEYLKTLPEFEGAIDC